MRQGGGGGGWSTVRIRSEHRLRILARVQAGEASSLSSWIDHTLAAALSETQGPPTNEQASPGPVGSTPKNATPLEPVREAAPQQELSRLWAEVRHLNERVGRLEELAGVA
jgi:hypothetical protein